MYFKNVLIVFIFIFIIFTFMFFRQEKYKKGNCYYNQKDELVCEKIEAVSGLNFLYNNSLGKIIRNIVNKKVVSQISGWYQDCWLSKFKIKPFVKKYNIEMSDFLLSVDQFKSFNDFFIRKLEPGARPISDNNAAVISPADSKLLVIPDVSLDVEFFVKNKKFNLKTFFQDKSLQDETLAEKYKNGLMLVFRLAPNDYHRYHFPFDCFAGDSKIINGILESVNPIVYKSGVQPLYENERQLMILNSDLFGEVPFVSVGAMFVGKIVQAYDKSRNNK